MNLYFLQRLPDVIEWDRRLREDQAERRKAHRASNPNRPFVSDYYSDDYREEMLENGTRVVTWIAHEPHGFLFDPTDIANENLGYRDARSRRERLRNASIDGDPVGGDYVPRPNPIGRRAKRPAALDYPFLLRAAFYARCYAQLGYVEIKTGKGNKPRREVDLIRRWLSEHRIEGWPQSYLVYATGRSKPSVAKTIAAERAERIALLANLTPPELYWHPLRRIQISRPSEVPVPRRTGASPARSDDRAARPLLVEQAPKIAEDVIPNDDRTAADAARHDAAA